MLKFLLHFDFVYPTSTVTMPHRRIRALYEHMLQLESGRVIVLTEAGWENGRIARNLCRNGAAIRRCCQA